MASLHYYNEWDPYCAAWLRNLMDAGHIPAGDIDTRSIEDVRPDELAGYVQCHFFAGVGGWALALKLAGWSDRKLWTGSCPCQPFSVAGKGAGTEDQRHLWPSWFHLISQCRPPVVFGEQVAAAVGHQWLDGVCADLEGQDYAIGAAVLPACAVGAPHRRDRLWFVADTRSAGLAQRERERGVLREVGGGPQGENAAHDDRALGNSESIGCDRGSGPDQTGHGQATIGGSYAGSDHTVANADEPGASEEWQQRSWQQRGPSRNPWARHSWIIGHDGKARRVEPEIRLLAHGLPNRVGRLRAYGNAIVPQAAAAFITAYAEARGLDLGSIREAA